MPAGIVSGAAFARGVETLRANGFNLLAVFDCAALPERIGSAIAGFDFDPAGYERLVVLGNGGGQFWDSLTRSVGTVSSLESDHPVDQFSRFNVENTVRDHWGDGDFRILYPGEPGVPLQQLGRLAGWHHDSPLGIGIHRAYGPWFAYRAAFLIDASLPLSNEPDTDSPCDA
ncbi:MAG TPA: hypothetical protein QF901_16020, partial [Gammaproteobacteria bacterium]|nr:hypothetical protein [Gammaproteobacteria bacterium]